MGLKVSSSLAWWFLNSRIVRKLCVGIPSDKMVDSTFQNCNVTQFCTMVPELKKPITTKYGLMVHEIKEQVRGRLGWENLDGPSSLHELHGWEGIWTWFSQVIVKALTTTPHWPEVNSVWCKKVLLTFLCRGWYVVLIVAVNSLVYPFHNYCAMAKMHAGLLFYFLIFLRFHWKVLPD